MKKIIFGLFIAMAMISCVKEEFSEADSGLKTLSANVENDIDTKVGFTDGEAAFFWTKGDKIGVTTTQSSTSFSLMNLDDEDAGKSSGSFTGSMAGNPQGYAVYPYISDKHSMSGTILTYHMPSEYTYSKLDGTYASSVGNSHNAPMYGIIDNGNVAFKHLGGVIAFQINELQGNTAYTFKLTADKQISGDFEVNLNADTPQLVASVTDNASEKSVSVSFTTSKDQTSGYIYMPIPTGIFESLNIKVYQGGTEIVNTTFENKTINRKAIIRTTIGEQSLEGGEVNEVSSVEDVTKVLESVSESTEDVIVEVTEEVTGSQAIEIPAELETETTTIKFNEVANDATITINNENNGAYAGQIIIEIPAEATIPVIEANVPEGEVYIKQGNVTNLVVSSKENTTIIGAGVQVDKLTVKKGNVRIQEGGVVNEICRSDDNKDDMTYVYVANTNLSFSGDKIITMYLSGDAILASNAEQLKKAIEDGGRIELKDNITLDEVLMVSKDVTIVGNEYALTTSATRAIRITESNVTFKAEDVNIKSTASQEGTSDIRGISVDTNTTGVNLDLKNCSVTFNPNDGDDWAYAVNLCGNSSGHTLKINGGSYEGANVINIWGSQHNITIENAVLTSTYMISEDCFGLCVVLDADNNNQSSGNTLTIKNTEFNGKNAKAVKDKGTENTVIVEGNTDNTKQVVAKIGEKYYNSLQEAINAVSDKEVITLCSDIELSEVLTVTGGVKQISGNNHTITTSATRAMRITNSNTTLWMQDVNIKSTASQVGTSDIRGISVDTNTTGVNLDLKNCSVTFNPNDGDDWAYAVNLCGNSSGHTLKINGGSYEGANVINIWGSQHDITIENAKLTSTYMMSEGWCGLCVVLDADNNNQSSGNTLTIKNTEFYGENAKAVKDKGTDNTVDIQNNNKDYTQLVVAKKNSELFNDLESAINATKDNDMITLLCDITIDKSISINNNITLDLNGKTVTATS